MPDTDPRHEVSCVFPSYNEADCLEETIAEWAAALAVCTRAFEIIVVDDGSTDGTAALLRDLAARAAYLRVITHDRNLGYGAAIAHGFAQAAYPLACFSDADGQYDPTDLPAFLERIDGADIVAGYRVRRADPGIRRLLSDGYNALARLLIGVPLRDLNCAFKLMSRDVFRRLGVASTDFLVNADFVLRARTAGLLLVEVPVRHRPRRAGRSTVRPTHILGGLLGLARLRLSPPRVPAPGAARPGAA